MMKNKEANSQKNQVLQTLRNLDWTPNIAKCDLTMTTKTTFVGFIIDLDTPRGPWIKVLPAKIRKLRRAIVKELQANCNSARNLTKVAGQCIAMTKAIMPGKLLLRNIYRVIATRQTWDDNNLCLTESARKDLNWWLEALKGWNGAPLITHPVDIQIETDASSTGWGSCIKTESSVIEAAGLWNKQVSFKHSNFRELLAVLQAIKSFRRVARKPPAPAGAIRQHCDGSVYKSFRRTMHGTIRSYDYHMDNCSRNEYHTFSATPGRSQKFCRRWTELPGIFSRLEASPKSVQTIRQDVGTPYSRQICSESQHTTTNFQFNVLGSRDNGSGCHGTGLEKFCVINEFIY